jgi:nucleotide-binding universal stress UspA family protein
MNSVSSPPEMVIYEYNTILIAHDGTEMSDKALTHAISLSLISKGGVIILNVIEEEIIPPSFLLAFLNEKGIDASKQKLRDTFEASTRQFLEDKVKLCKEKGVQNVSYLIKIGKLADGIIDTANETNADIVVMASSRISSSIRVLGSNARKVLDSIQKPIMIVHE